MNSKAHFLVAVALLATGCLDVTHIDADNPKAYAAAIAAGPRGRLDVVIALGCPADDESGAPSMCERCRVKSALRAYREGEVGAVLMTGGAAHNRFVEADAMGDLALRRGLPPSVLAREPKALTTWMNLRFAQRLMREHGWKSALIVSTAAHLPRARRFAEWYGIEARYRACDRDFPPDDEAEWRGAIVQSPLR